jgi:hypothetical protein
MLALFHDEDSQIGRFELKLPSQAGAGEPAAENCDVVMRVRSHRMFSRSRVSVKVSS